MTTFDESIDCPVCALECTIERIAPPSPHWGRFRCPSCGKHRGWAATPPSEYHAFKMPFGRHKGRTLAEIAKAPSGVGYLQWCAASLTNDRLRQVIGTYLEQLKAQQAPKAKPKPKVEAKAYSAHRPAAHHGQVSVRRICENLGIAIRGQTLRLKRATWTTVTMIVTDDAAGGEREMAMIPWQDVPCWLMTIDSHQAEVPLHQKV